MDGRLVVDTGDPPMLRLDGGLSINLGDNIAIDLPAWLGGPITADHLIELVNMDANGVIDRNHLAVDGQLKLLGDLVTVTGGAELDWQKGQFDVSGALDIADGFVTATGSVSVGSRLDLVARGDAVVSIPNAVPWIGGTQIGSGHFLHQFVNDLNNSNDFVAGWGSIGPLQLGLRAWFDGRWDILGAREINSLQQQGEGSDGEGEGESLASESYSVAAATDWVLFAAEWENASTTAAFTLKTPSGQVLSQADIEADPSMEIVAELTNTRRKAVLVNGPDPGIWTVTLSDTTDLGAVDVGALISDPVPSVAVVGASGGLLREPVQIELEAYNPDSDARIALFYDTDNQGYDGVMIADGIIETDGPTQYTWDTSGTVAGDYYIYPSIMDEHNAPVLAYSDLPVSITDPKGEIRGTKWNDLDGDGVRDDDEPGLADWTINLDGDDASTTTDRNGEYAFTGLLPGAHVVAEVHQEGWAQTHPADTGIHTVTLSLDEVRQDVDFGNRVNLPPSVANAIPDQSTEENQPFGFAFAADAFHDADPGEVLAFTAALSDGSSLPTWLAFDGTTRNFSGIPPLGANGELDIKVTATDAGGLAVGAEFAITVTPDPHPWQNPGLDADDPMDVDDNGDVTPLDVLTIIVYINQNGSGRLPPPSTPSQVEHLYVDVDGNNHCTPLDVLMVIAHINGQLRGSGEGGAAHFSLRAGAAQPSTSGIGSSPGTAHYVSDTAAVPNYHRSASDARSLRTSVVRSDAGQGIFGRVAHIRQATITRLSDHESVNDFDASFPELDAILPDIVGEIDSVWNKLSQNGNQKN